MSVLMVRARIRPGSVAEIQAAVKDMFRAIEEVRPDGVRYASSRLPDGETYLILLEVEDGIANPLQNLAAFRAFQENLKKWLAEPPTVENLTVIGSYRLF